MQNRIGFSSPIVSCTKLRQLYLHYKQNFSEFTTDTMEREQVLALYHCLLHPSVRNRENLRYAPCCHSFVRAKVKTQNSKHYSIITVVKLLAEYQQRRGRPVGALFSVDDFHQLLDELYQVKC